MVNVNIKIVIALLILINIISAVFIISMYFNNNRDFRTEEENSAGYIEFPKTYDINSILHNPTNSSGQVIREELQEITIEIPDEASFRRTLRLFKKMQQELNSIGSGPENPNDLSISGVRADFNTFQTFFKRADEQELDSIQLSLENWNKLSLAEKKEITAQIKDMITDIFLSSIQELSYENIENSRNSYLEFFKTIKTINELVNSGTNQIAIKDVNSQLN